MATSYLIFFHWEVRSIPPPLEPGELLAAWNNRIVQKYCCVRVWAQASKDWAMSISWFSKPHPGANQLPHNSQNHTQGQISCHIRSSTTLRLPSVLEAQVTVKGHGKWDPCRRQWETRSTKALSLWMTNLSWSKLSLRKPWGSEKMFQSSPSWIPYQQNSKQIKWLH